MTEPRALSLEDEPDSQPIEISDYSLKSFDEFDEGLLLTIRLNADNPYATMPWTELKGLVTKISVGVEVYSFTVTGISDFWEAGSLPYREITGKQIKE